MLSGDEILRLGIVRPGDGAEALPLDQGQVNGVDLTLDAVWQIDGRGQLGQPADDRQLPERIALEFDDAGWVSLPTGTFGIRFREPVSIPLDCGGLSFPRSSLLRMGAHIPTAVWDAGYTGRAETLVVVGASGGLRLQYGARIAQIVFFRLSAPTAGYRGRYQGENL